MPESVLGSNLVDELVPVADELRSELFPEMGVRQFRVFLEKRRWSGIERGDGSALAAHYSVELDPRPLVRFLSLEESLTACGREEDGVIELTEISLTFTEGELMGTSQGALAQNEQFFYRVADGHGQGIATRYFTPVQKPESDRIKTIGWRILLRRTELG